MFRRCSTLQPVEIANSVDFIGEEAFESCTALENIQPPTSLSLIERAAFRGCSALKHVVTPDSVTVMGKPPFNRAVPWRASRSPTGFRSLTNVCLMIAMP